MFGSNLRKHIKEIRNYILNHQYEMGEGSIYFPKARATIGGIYTHNVNGEDERSDHNIIPDEGLKHVLGVTVAGVTPVTSWYVALHEGSSAPGASLTAANYTGTLNEHSSAPEGYTEANRVLYVDDTITDTEVVNLTTPAAFTIVTASTLTVWGGAILSVNTKNSTSGTLLSAGKFTSARTLDNADVFNLKYKIDLNAV